MEIECILSGFGIRGYTHYKDKWNLQQHDKKVPLACKTYQSDVGETLGVFLRSTLVGSMPSILSNQEKNIRLKNFFKNFPGKTEIVAMVTENVPRKDHGLEVACEFYLRGQDTQEIRRFLENVRTEVNKLGKQTAGISCSKIKKIRKRSKKTLATEDTASKKNKRPLSAYQLFVRDKSAEIQVQNPGLSFKERSAKQAQMWREIDPKLKEVYESKARKLNKNNKKDIKRRDKKQSVISKSDPKKGAPRKQIKGGQKRPSVEQEETIPKKIKGGRKRPSGEQEETIPKKIKGGRKRPSGEQEETIPKKIKGGRKRTSGEQEETIPKKEVQEHESDDKIILEFEDLYKICDHVGKNWRRFGSELGVSETKMDHFEEDNNKNTMTAIFEMLKLWKKENFSTASLKKFLQAMKRCPTVTFNETALNKVFEDKRKKYQNGN